MLAHVHSVRLIVSKRLGHHAVNAARVVIMTLKHMGTGRDVEHLGLAGISAWHDKPTSENGGDVTGRLAGCRTGGRARALTM